MNRPSFALSVLLAALAGSLLATGSANSQTRSVLVNKTKTSTPGHRTGVEKVPGPVRVGDAKRMPETFTMDELCRVQLVKIPFAWNTGESSQVVAASTEVVASQAENIAGDFDYESGYRCWTDEYQFAEKMAEKTNDVVENDVVGNLVDEILKNGKNTADKLAAEDTEDYFTPADSINPEAVEQPLAPEVDEQPEAALPEAVQPELKPEIVPLATDLPAEDYSDSEDDLWNGGESSPVRIGAILPNFDDISKVAGWGLYHCEQLADLAGWHSMGWHRLGLGEGLIALQQQLDPHPGFFGEMKIHFLLTMQDRYQTLRLAQQWQGEDYRGLLSLRDIYSLDAELAPLPEVVSPEVVAEELPADDLPAEVIPAVDSEVAGGQWVVGLGRQMLVGLAGTLEGTANQLYALSSELHQAAGEMKPALSSRPSRRIR